MTISNRERYRMVVALSSIIGFWAGLILFLTGVWRIEGINPNLPQSAHWAIHALSGCGYFSSGVAIIGAPIYIVRWWMNKRKCKRQKVM